MRLISREIRPESVARNAQAFDMAAYLSASFQHSEATPLLAGKVILNHNGMFIGKGRLVLVATGDRVELAFGADDGIKVEACHCASAQ